MRQFFPGLSGQNVTADNPTVDHRVIAELFIENQYVGTVSTRYQIQTWGDTRNPESRLTDQLGPLRNAAQQGDMLIIQRAIDRLDHYRLTLVRRESPDFQGVIELTTSRRWGVLTSNSPIAETDLDTALLDEQTQENEAFVLFDDTARNRLSAVNKVARSIVFRKTVLSLYEETCSLCGETLMTPAGLLEVDAAHIVPRYLLGVDDARNGLALCKRHHWAFDKGMFGVGDDRKVIIPVIVASIAQNLSLANFRGLPIREAKNQCLQAHPDAFRWHRENLLLN